MDLDTKFLEKLALVLDVVNEINHENDAKHGDKLIRVQIKKGRIMLYRLYCYEDGSDETEIISLSPYKVLKLRLIDCGDLKTVIKFNY